MTTNISHQTAKIYQFPIGGRASVLGFRKANSPASQLNRPRPPATAMGDGWYHDAAIEDAKRSTEH